MLAKWMVAATMVTIGKSGCQETYKMNMPGFTAEKAVYETSATYELEKGNNIRQSGEVQPQLPPELGCYFRCGGDTGWWYICAYACARDPHIW